MSVLFSETTSVPRGLFVKANPVMFCGQIGSSEAKFGGFNPSRTSVEQSMRPYRMEHCANTKRCLKPGRLVISNMFLKVYICIFYWLYHVVPFLTLLYGDFQSHGAPSHPSEPSIAQRRVQEVPVATRAR